MPLSEADTRAKLIDPALHDAGWTEDLVRRETTAGGIDIIDGRPRKRKGRTDYLLCLPVGQGLSPLAVAVIEAKPESEPHTVGLNQAKKYARRLHVLFVYSSNGHLFAEYDDSTGITRDNLPLTALPRPEELRRRYEHGEGLSLDSQAARPLLIPYKGGESVRRYYQDATVRACLEKIAAGGKRALLPLATASGKTYVAAYLLWKLAQAGQLRRALFVCDRTFLAGQGNEKLHGIFGDDAAVVTTSNPQKNARILIATYQTLNVGGDSEEEAPTDASFLLENYPEDYFSHIIIDECHRSAWGKWSIILTHNPNAVRIGLTATPRTLVGASDEDQEITANNLKYFGEPVYEYSFGQGVEDGYLAPPEVVRRVVNLDAQGQITRDEIEQRTAQDFLTGQPAQEKDIRPSYLPHEYDDILMLPDRVKAMCQDLFQLLCESGGPLQKTIIFCARDAHADAVANELNNLYAHWCRANGQVRLDCYAFKCTVKADNPGADLAEFKGSRRSHLVATTVDLLSTGVDIEWLRNVVFFRYLQSSILFYQMVGRGTRIHVPSGKLMFRIYDYTNATRLFGEPFLSKARPTGGEDGGEAPERKERIIRVEGFDVQVTEAGRSVLVERDGQDVLMPLEEYRQMVAERLAAEAPDLDTLRLRWLDSAEREALLSSLPGGERSARLLQQLDDLADCDLYDVLAQEAYGVAPKTRQERAEALLYKHAKWLKELPPKAAGVIKALAGQFAKGGVGELENVLVFQTPEVTRAGGVEALRELGADASTVLRIAKERLLAA
jgi:type I restriction enzyme, R subunit